MLSRLRYPVELAMAAVSLLLLSLFTANTSFADPITYDYTGSPLTTCYSFSSSPCSIYSIQGSLTLADPLAPNEDSPERLFPTSFSFSDGDPNHPLFTNSNANTDYFYVYETDGNGVPISWAFFIDFAVNTCSSGYQITSYATDPFDCSGGSYGGWEGQSDGPGSWSIAPDPPPQSTPEPSSLLLLGSGLFAIFIYGWRQSSHRSFEVVDGKYGSERAQVSGPNPANERLV
jgi:hypothetical protein